MSESKQAIWKRTLAEGLASANKGNPFWTRADAMGNLARSHNARKLR